MKRILSGNMLITSVVSLLLVIFLSTGVSYADDDVSLDSATDVSEEAVVVFGDFSFDFVLETSEEAEELSSFAGDLSKNDESAEISEDTVSDLSENSLDVSEDVSEDASNNESSQDIVESEDPSADSSEVSDVISDFSEESLDLSKEVSEDSKDMSEEPSVDSSDVSEDVSDAPSDVEYPSDVTVLENGKRGFVYFKQDDPRYDKIPYGKNTVGSHGCGPVNMAMIISTYTGKVVYPAEAAEWSVKNGYCVSNVGTSHDLMTKMAQAYGVPVSTIPLHAWDDAMQALKDGKYLMTRVDNGAFSGGPHFLTIRGITEDGKLLLANSISYDDSVTAWSQSVVKENISLSKFWVYG